MTPEEKEERVNLLIEIGEEVENEFRKRQEKVGADPEEICFRQEIVKPLVDNYASVLEEYRIKHLSGNRAEGDKIAALSGTLIMRAEPFVSNTGKLSTPYSGSMNASYAMRAAQVFVAKKRFGFSPPEQRQMLFCFGHCYDHDPAMESWTVSTMTLHWQTGTVTEKKDWSD